MGKKSKDKSKTEYSLDEKKPLEEEKDGNDKPEEKADSTDGEKEPKDTEFDAKTENKRKLKKGSRIILIALASLLVLAGSLFLISKLLEDERFDFTKKVDGIYYFPADYNADPNDDPAYMAKERGVWFEDDKGLGVFLTEGEERSNSIKGLMYRYFQSLKTGDAEAHAKLLSKEYEKHFVVQEKFTCQKVHNIKVQFNKGDTVEGSGHWFYRVSYEIYENNGTYRADIGSETARVMSFDVVYEDGDYKINSIGYLTVKE